MLAFFIFAYVIVINLLEFTKMGIVLDEQLHSHFVL